MMLNPFKTVKQPSSAGEGFSLTSSANSNQYVFETQHPLSPVLPINID